MGGMSREQLLEEFPELEPEDINACLADVSSPSDYFTCY